MSTLKIGPCTPQVYPALLLMIDAAEKVDDLDSSYDKVMAAEAEPYFLLGVLLRLLNELVVNVGLEGFPDGEDPWGLIRDAIEIDWSAINE